jgi:hypothetical protein
MAIHQGFVEGDVSDLVLKESLGQNCLWMSFWMKNKNMTGIFELPTGTVDIEPPDFVV